MLNDIKNIKEKKKERKVTTRRATNRHLFNPNALTLKNKAKDAPSPQPKIKVEEYSGIATHLRNSNPYSPKSGADEVERCTSSQISGQASLVHDSREIKPAEEAKPEPADEAKQEPEDSFHSCVSGQVSKEVVSSTTIDNRVPRQVITNKEEEVPLNVEEITGARKTLVATHCTSNISRAPEIIGAHSFKAHELLGTGSFGEVYLVEKISDLSLHAMKVLNKDKILENHLTRYALTE